LITKKRIARILMLGALTVGAAALTGLPLASAKPTRFSHLSADGAGKTLLNCVRFDIDDQPVCGIRGQRGFRGYTGATGATGRTGAMGATGSMGPMGATGATGAVGAQGAQGVAGVNGRDGTSFTWQGLYSAGKTYAKNDVVQATDGQSYISQAPDNIGNDPLAPNSSWWSLLAARGVAGQTGATGATGQTGTTGQTGATGAVGPQGPVGAQGPAGQSFIWKGAWSSTQTYGLNDVVEGSDGSSYISQINNNTNNDPTQGNTADWQELAHHGAQVVQSVVVDAVAPTLRNTGAAGSNVYGATATGVAQCPANFPNVLSGGGYINPSNSNGTDIVLLSNSFPGNYVSGSYATPINNGQALSAQGTPTGNAWEAQATVINLASGDTATLTAYALCGE
jgi:hypothetical protein